ncbi:MAG TPA: UDP-N-acetylmuramoyl-tripeptide--D-alanyl-D-alanine ligase [Cytophagaceae bacterium]|jgi:UDP-N-acetylmuramoyl-tripeptide--D-alanyl-D-alanine ligase|nr:UDP-N-acetylmuramoyl-tripeptide--D-alanyl-D-alanine ligase [Cytophagaceae bacterium]
MEIQKIYKHFIECDGISTDTRHIKAHSMFFALKGANFNGNSFAKDALDLGAEYAVVDEEKFKISDRYILVKDVLTALQDLANFHRKQFKIPFIAVTGTNGKTTSKELIKTVLSKKYITYATVGNLNNHIGIPLTILSIKRDVEIAVIEMGANHQKEIEGYCKIAEPSHGLITNIGKAHLEGFGGFEGVKKGKGELYEYLLRAGGVAFINSNNEILKEISKFTAPIYYPRKGDYYTCELLESTPFVIIETEEHKTVETQLTGAYNFENIAAALCIGKYFNVPADAANAAVARYDPQNNRSQIIEKAGNTIILDAYNANPSSMKAAIENFAKMKAGSKVLVLGDMFELGDESEAEHKNLGKLISQYHFDKVLLCGNQMSFAKEAYSSALYFPDKASLIEWFKANQIKDSHLLIKGSRGMGLEKALDVIL